ncbi:hypothetical protein RO3G_15107 [Rhizopus delemar RA 99-880]|uniref:Uncharacterized protein n=3 Tax=Rhizopus TaxID=4842 RepID=I1CPL6_RHIO9|nr:hypothetical protein RO3G_15107 [Rhizopus delemar RA 99-880]|eukprot:EIE90396.1 hypothetical protein RO3G_15107 [Rhizopus delemar RA 99-880]
METIIVEEYNGITLSEYRGMWKKLFRDNVKKMKLNPETSGKDFWATNIVKKLKEKTASEKSSETRTVCSSTSSPNYQKELKEDDYALLGETHAKIKNKWGLKSNSDKAIEDVIYEQARHYNYEH